MVEVPPRILVLDDDHSIRKALREQLTDEGFAPLVATSSEEAVRMADDDGPDLAIVEVRLPEKSGLELLKHIRKHNRIPVILISELSSTSDRMKGFEAGAADYVTKPFNPEELIARIRAILRRYVATNGNRRQAQIQIGELTVDLDARVVTRASEVLRLSRTEWKLLETLAQHRGRLISSEEIVRRVWGPRFATDGRHVSVWIRRLRRKIDGDRSTQSIIRTYRGIGYLLRD